jgi:hypothetical protein
MQKSGEGIPVWEWLPCSSKGNKKVIFICQNNTSWHGSNCTCWSNNTNKGGFVAVLLASILWVPIWAVSQLHPLGFECGNRWYVCLTEFKTSTATQNAVSLHASKNQGPLAHLPGRWIHQMICSASSHKIQNPLWNRHYGVHVPYLTKTVQNLWFWFLRHLLQWCSSYHHSQSFLMQNCMCHINAVLLCMHSVYMSLLISGQSFSLAHIYYGSLQYLVSPVSSQVLAMLSTKSNLWNLTILVMNNWVLQKDAQSTTLRMDSSSTSRRRVQCRRRVHPQRHISYQGKKYEVLSIL